VVVQVPNYLEKTSLIEAGVGVVAVENNKRLPSKTSEIEMTLLQDVVLDPPKSLTTPPVPIQEGKSPQLIVGEIPPL